MLNKLLAKHFESDVGVNKVAEHGKAFFRFAFEQRVDGLGIKCSCKFWIAFDAHQNRLFVVSHWHF